MTGYSSVTSPGLLLPLLLLLLQLLTLLSLLSLFLDSASSQSVSILVFLLFHSFLNFKTQRRIYHMLLQNTQNLHTKDTHKTYTQNTHTHTFVQQAMNPNNLFLFFSPENQFSRAFLFPDCGNQDLLYMSSSFEIFTYTHTRQTLLNHERFPYTPTHAILSRPAHPHAFLIYRNIIYTQFTQISRSSRGGLLYSMQNTALVGEKGKQG